MILRTPVRALWWGILAGSIGAVVLTVVAAITLFMYRTETVQVYPLPSGATYTAAVKRVHSPMDSGRYEVWLGRPVGDEVPRGHVVAVPAGWSSHPRIDWTVDEVVLDFDPGGEIRVPMSMVIDTR
ncbi:hypothetical protein [Nocardia sp. NPDC004722]